MAPLNPARMFSLPQIAQRFKGRSVNGRIFRAALSVTAAGILVKIVATFKEFAVAGVYGRSDVMDAFLAAYLIPNLLINLISESMNQALVSACGSRKATIAPSNCSPAPCSGSACCWPPPPF